MNLAGATIRPAGDQRCPTVVGEGDTCRTSYDDAVQQHPGDRVDNLCIVAPNHVQPLAIRADGSAKASNYLNQRNRLT